MPFRNFRIIIRLIIIETILKSAHRLCSKLLSNGVQLINVDFRPHIMFHEYVKQRLEAKRGFWIAGVAKPKTVTRPAYHYWGPITERVLPDGRKVGNCFDFTHVFACFCEVRNGWIVPIEIVLPADNEVLKELYVNMRPGYEISSGCLGEADLENLSSYVEGKWRKKKANFFPKSLEYWRTAARKERKFDKNCRKRMLGLLQGVLYKMLDDEDFEPHCLVGKSNKRKLKLTPKGDLDWIALCVVDFIPVWDIFRDCSRDFFQSW